MNTPCVVDHRDPTSIKNYTECNYSMMAILCRSVWQAPLSSTVEWQCVLEEHPTRILR
jgi:hypothetical protein